LDIKMGSFYVYDVADSRQLKMLHAILL